MNSNLQQAISFLELYKNEDTNLDRRVKVSSFLDEIERIKDQVPLPEEQTNIKDPNGSYPTVDWDFQKKIPAFNVFGVQMYQDKQLQGTALYCTMPRARMIRDILNKEYARINANNFEAKITPFHVF